MRHPYRLVAAVVMLLLGLVWIAQGTGLIGGSVMSGQSIWAVIGIVVIAAGIAVAWTATRRTAGG